MLQNRVELSDSEINKSQEQAIEYFEEFRKQMMREEWFPVKFLKCSNISRKWFGFSLQCLEFFLKKKLVSNPTNKFFSVGRRKRDCSGK